MEAIGSSTDVESITADPRRWLNPAGHDLLSEVTGFERRNSSMLWGTYRPGVYFGEDEYKYHRLEPVRGTHVLTRCKLILQAVPQSSQ